MPKIKLTDKQKEVIKVMRKGKKLYKNTTYCYIQKADINVSLATLFKLMNDGIITIGNKTDFGWHCPLTELGKTIEL
jgi:hypothetical protein